MLELVTLAAVFNTVGMIGIGLCIMGIEKHI